ncbi:MAG: PIN domain-containing protein [Nitrospiria bacterium]
MAKHLIDSDVLISFLRGKLPALSLMKDLSQDEVPAISSISYYEIWVGVRPEEEKFVLTFLSSLQILPIDQSIAQEAGNYVRDYRRKGITLSSMDTLIAATAKINKLTLITSNIRDFPMKDILKQPL